MPCALAPAFAGALLPPALAEALPPPALLRCGPPDSEAWSLVAGSAEVPHPKSAVRRHSVRTRGRATRRRLVRGRECRGLGLLMSSAGSSLGAQRRGRADRWCIELFGWCQSFCCSGEQQRPASSGKVPRMPVIAVLSRERPALLLQHAAPRMQNRAIINCVDSCYGQLIPSEQPSANIGLTPSAARQSCTPRASRNAPSSAGSGATGARAGRAGRRRARALGSVGARSASAGQHDFAE